MCFSFFMMYIHIYRAAPPPIAARATVGTWMSVTANVYVYVCVCMCTYIYIYIYTHIIHVNVHTMYTHTCSHT